MRGIRKIAAWLCQQFSRCILASAEEGKSIHALNLCVRHDVAVLDVGTTFLAASRTLSLKEIAMRPKETSADGRRRYFCESRSRELSPEVRALMDCYKHSTLL